MVGTPESLKYGKPSRSQAEVFVTMAGQAFAFDPAQWLSSLGSDGWDNMRTLTDDDAVVGGLVIHRTAQWFGGRSVVSHALSAVLSAPEARRRRLGYTLMSHGLREARQEGVPLAVLYASTPAFYRQLGFEPAGQRLFWRVPAHHLPAETEGARYVPVGPEAKSELQKLYASLGRACSGLVERNEHFWRAHLNPYDGSKLYPYRIELDGRLEGYVSLKHARPERTLFVQDALATTPRAARALLAFLSHHKSVVDWVVFPDGPQGPLRKHIADNAARPEPPHEEWLLRILDVRAALEGRGYPELDAAFELEVIDTALPENAGRYVFSLERGKPSVRRGGDGRLSLDVRALAAIYSGFAHPSELYAAGLLAGAARDVALFGSVFAGPRPFLLDSF